MAVWDELSPAGPVHLYDKTVARQPFYDDYGQFQLLAREGDIVIPHMAATEPLLFLPWAVKRTMPAKLSESIQAILVELGRSEEAVRASRRMRPRPLIFAAGGLDSTTSMRPPAPTDGG